MSSTLALLYATKHTVAVYYAALMWQQVTDTKPHQVAILSSHSQGCTMRNAVKLFDLPR